MLTAQNSQIVNERPLTYETARYGMLVEVLNEKDSGYHAGCKIHFFNKKGVLVGNYYQFLPYKRIRIREGSRRQYPRYFMAKNYLKRVTPASERLKMWFFVRLLNFQTLLLRYSERIMD